MECVICGGDRAREVVETRIGRYRDERVPLESRFYRCGDCGDDFFSPEQAKAHTKAVKNEIRKKYGLLPPERIVSIREKLELTQAELEEILGTGPKVVIRWESGKVIQSRGQDNVLRVLDQDPSFLTVLRQVQKLRSEEQEKYRIAHRQNDGKMVAQAAAM